MGYTNSAQRKTPTRTLVFGQSVEAVICASVLGQFLANFSVLSGCVESPWEGRLFAETNKNTSFATFDDSRLLWTTPQNPTHNRLVAGSNPAGPTICNVGSQPFVSR